MVRSWCWSPGSSHPSCRIRCFNPKANFPLSTLFSLLSISGRKLFAEDTRNLTQGSRVTLKRTGLMTTRDMQSELIYPSHCGTAPDLLIINVEALTLINFQTRYRYLCYSCLPSFLIRAILMCAHVCMCLSVCLSVCACASPWIAAWVCEYECMYGSHRISVGVIPWALYTFSPLFFILRESLSLA